MSVAQCNESRSRSSEGSRHGNVDDREDGRNLVIGGDGGLLVVDDLILRVAVHPLAQLIVALPTSGVLVKVLMHVRTGHWRLRVGELCVVRRVVIVVDEM